MILKERLEELIKNNIPFWYIEDRQVRETHQTKYWKIAEDRIVWYVDKDLYKKFETIFETKEAAEEYLEFDTTQKTETLFMCDWDIAKDEKYGYCANFWVDGSNYSMLISGDVIYVQEEYYSGEKWNKDILFKENLNRENYDKARRLCKKLFLGEQVC